MTVTDFAVAGAAANRMSLEDYQRSICVLTEFIRRTYAGCGRRAAERHICHLRVAESNRRIEEDAAKSDRMKRANLINLATTPIYAALGRNGQGQLVRRRLLSAQFAALPGRRVDRLSTSFDTLQQTVNPSA